ncbi:AI-2E family transporter [Pseudomonas sp. ABC1]|uniref:AI-2E family transporter n=1 Tax=Pseudomonas sp. ABC1 TaxID=2748080 RepID=UPI0015C40061|nr:AI-2E family transporter [Pseudomonas sp. ABC1]QLF92495.1 AI-2E family transporter [Pseudomonas sp. ABC1]
MGNLIFEQKVFLSLLVLVTLAFGWILWPFYGAVFWAVILAILFSPLQRRLLIRFNNRRNLAALTTLLASLLIAVLPVIFITGLLVQEGTTLYARINSGELDVGSYVIQVKEMLPASIQGYLQRFGLSDMSDLRERLGSSALQGSQYLATKAFSFGQGTFQFVIGFFVMLYLLFFLIRDGRDLVKRLYQAVPLSGDQKKKLFSKFTQVVRATVKGNIIIAVVQGALGGLIFAILGIPSALLWGVLMALLSLLPAVGAGLIWTPVAIYFLLSGSIVSGVVLIAYGILVIGLVDNLLRPTLVGKDTKMPDYVVLISTLGGLSLFGLNGFVIGPLIAALFMASWDLFTEREEEAGVEGA